MNVLEKLAQVQQKLAVPKDNKNSFGNYNYRSAEDIESKVKPLLEEVKATIVLTDEMVEVGGRVYVKAKARFIDLEVSSDIEVVDAIAYAREAETKKGMDDSQITGSTSSYARKYALGGLLLIDNEKDADSTNKHGKEPQKVSAEATSPRKATISEELVKLKTEILGKYKESGKDPAKFTDFLIQTIGLSEVRSVADAKEVLDALN